MLLSSADVRAILERRLRATSSLRIAECAIVNPYVIHAVVVDPAGAPVLGVDVDRLSGAILHVS